MMPTAGTAQRGAAREADPGGARGHRGRVYRRAGAPREGAAGRGRLLGARSGWRAIACRQWSPWPPTRSPSACWTRARSRPARTREGDAGYDLRCLERLRLAPGERAMVGTGVAIALPPGVAGLVTPRSGLAARHGISLVNGPGLVDPNYRGELRVVLVNLGAEPFEAQAGDRIAQLLLVPVLGARARGGRRAAAVRSRANGFGSSGSASPSRADRWPSGSAVRAPH